MNQHSKLSIVVPVSERHDDILEVFKNYKKAIELVAQNYEFIYVLDGKFEDSLAKLRRLQDDGENIKIIMLAKRFGESAALSAGFEKADGDLILTLPAYFQVDISELGKMFDAIEHNDVVIVRRSHRIDSAVNRLQTSIFNSLQRFITKSEYQDLGCSVRLIKSLVIKEVQLYGDQHRFYPILADIKGFKVDEVALPQSGFEKKIRLYGPGVYLRRLLDLATVFFSCKIYKKTTQIFWPNWNYFI